MTLKFSKAVFIRLVWFVVGGVFSVGLNAGLFRLLHTHLEWNRFLAYAVSLGTTNVVLFLWNYFVGFRTRRRWGGAAWRHAVCIGVANALNYTLVVILHGIFPQWQEAVIAAVQVGIAFFKFGLYHYWVYPYAPPEPAIADGVGPAGPPGEESPPSRPH